MLFNLLLLVVSLLLLTVGAELLVRGSVMTARRMGVSSFFIGLTIVGFGTSTPELATGIQAALQGKPDICIGNSVGSNIFNIAFILGLTALLAPIAVHSSAVRREVPLVIGVSLLPYAGLMSDSSITRVMGLAALGLLFLIIWMQYRRGSAEGSKEEAALTGAAFEVVAPAKPEGASGLWWRAGFMIAVGLVLLIGGSKVLVMSAVELARWSGMSELVISLTVIAAGTSAPELFTSAVAAWRKESDLSVGNILGSNVFNMLAIIGSAAVVFPQRISPQVLWLDAPVMLALSAACLPIMWTHGRISRSEGGVLLIAYGAYLYVLIWQAPVWFA